MACREVGGFKHEHRWNKRRPDLWERWVHGWYVIIHKRVSNEWRADFHIRNREQEEIGAVTIERRNVSSVTNAMAQALKIIHQLRALNMGVRA